MNQSIISNYTVLLEEVANLCWRHTSSGIFLQHPQSQPWRILQMLATVSGRCHKNLTFSVIGQCQYAQILGQHIHRANSFLYRISLTMVRMIFKHLPSGVFQKYKLQTGIFPVIIRECSLFSSFFIALRRCSLINCQCQGRYFETLSLSLSTLA